ncbi:MAG: hypothetical protein IGS03_10445 [Candidatus Sericytochromatia bacterium]|nr:hypothetical protein [Candidatus Sericytochromatia bacterium]
MKNAAVALGLVILGLVIWQIQSPDKPQKIIQNMKLHDDRIELKGKTYAAEWAEDALEFEGVARFLKPEYNRFAPFNTHILLLATGDYANPDMIEILENGKVRLITDAIPKAGPEGDFNTFHLVPQDLAMVKKN